MLIIGMKSNKRLKKYKNKQMKKLIKKFKAWLACLVRADEVYLVMGPSKNSPTEENPEWKVLIATHNIEDAIEFMNTYSDYNLEQKTWLQKTVVY